jgi:hypothetical protein
MKNQSKFRLLALVGVFGLLSFSMSSCFSGGYGYNNGYYRPFWGYGFNYGYRPQVRVYVAPRRNYYQHDYRRNYGGGNYGNNNRSYHRENGNSRSSNSRNGRR